MTIPPDIKARLEDLRKDVQDAEGEAESKRDIYAGVSAAVAKIFDGEPESAAQALISLYWTLNGEEVAGSIDPNLLKDR